MKNWRIKPIKLPNSKFIKGELIGAFAGDGNYYHATTGKSNHHRIRYCLSYKDDKDYAKYLSKLILNIGLNPWIFIKKRKGVPTGRDVTFNSIKFYEFIKNYLYWKDVKTYSICLKGDINNYSKEFLLGFARGLMDTDGFVDKHNITLGCGSVSKELIKDLESIFLKINIFPKVTIRKRLNKKDLYLLRISRKYLEIYCEKVGFSNIRKKLSLLALINERKISQ